ncbi:MAG TPA: four-helix bundle copper-binding protein [Terriglobales bacterium]|nr:four-helix bundle copper-binding protein [Terriglobales bacterium]
MERREFLTGLAATAAVAAASQAFAQTEPSSLSGGHAARFPALGQSSSNCVTAGEACLRHCFGMLSMNDASMGGCIQAAYAMIAVCNALQALAAVNSAYVPSLAKAAIEVCSACQTQCEKYPNVPECKACAEACAKNVAECKRVAA